MNLQYAGRFDQLAAQAELYLYSTATPYFKGAQIGNVSNAIYSGGRDTFNAMWRQGQEAAAGDGSNDSSYAAHERATIGTIQHTDGKVASIRWVSVDPIPKQDAGAHHAAQGKGWLSWLGGRHHHSNPPKQALNVLEIGKPAQDAAASDDEEKVVLLHGYGAGTGFFFQNISALASRPNSRLYALDWLGMGRSSRPSFSVPSEALKDDLTRVQKAESFFVDSLEEWRKRAGIEKMKLVGHSLGGYLSVAYTLRHPTRVSQLVLVSPAGVGPQPAEAQAAQQKPSKASSGSDSGDDKEASSTTFNPKNASYIPKHQRGDIDADAVSIHSVEREVLEPQENTVPETKQQVRDDVKAASAGGSSHPASHSESKSKNNGNGHNPPPRFSPRTRSFFAWLWEQNYSPFGILRTSQFFGPWLMSRYTTRRFGALPEEELKALHAYCQGVFLAKGSGEYCLAHLLLPGAWARVPIYDRVDALCDPSSPTARLPISFIYGEHDWMDAKSGYDVVKKLRALGNDQGRAMVVSHAGHHVYLDNPRAFDRLLARILDGRENSSRASVE